MNKCGGRWEGDSSEDIPKTHGKKRSVLCQDQYFVTVQVVHHLDKRREDEYEVHNLVCVCVCLLICV
jgi:hypothetical protein